MKKRLQSSSAVKKSVVLSGLVGTGGLFVAKLLGLVYSIPLSSILGSDAYMSYYGTAYRIYSYILNVFTAGFPFAIATLVARYSVGNYNKVLLRIKKMSVQAMETTGFIGMCLMMVLSIPLAKVVAEPGDDQIMGTCLRLLAVAIFFVPVLSAYRGFYQGRKEMEEYAFSQAFEQIFRVAFLLGMSMFLVYGLKMERKWALYVSVLSTSVAAIAGILQIMSFDKAQSKDMIKAAKKETYRINEKALRNKFLSLAIPYLLVAVMGYCDDIFNGTLLPIGLRAHGYDQATISVILSATNYVGTKLTAIPMILAPGFTAAIIPHIASARAEKDQQKIAKNVCDCINIVLYIAIPVSLCITLYSKELYYTLFHTNDLETSAWVVRWLAIEGLLGTITPVITNIVLSLGMKKEVLRHLLENFVIRGVSMVPFIKLWGFPGVLYSAMLGYAFVIYTNLRDVNRKYNISFQSTVNAVWKMALSAAVMVLVYAVLKKAGLYGVDHGRLRCLGMMVISGIIVLLVYLAVTGLLRVPQEILGTDFRHIISGLKRQRNAEEE